jgi:hypothetical protein
MLKTSPRRQLHQNQVAKKALYLKEKIRRPTGIALATGNSRASFTENGGMKALAVLSLMIVVSSGYAASAAPLNLSDYSDVEVVSVTPRDPAVKPLVMAIFTKEQQQRVAAAAFKKNVFASQDTNHSR